MNKWKVAFFCSLIFSIVVITGAAYLLIDAGVTQTYSNDGYQGLKKNCKSLADFYPKGVLQEDALVELRKKFPKAFITVEKNVVDMEGLKFIFDKDNKLTSIDPEGMYH